MADLNYRVILDDFAARHYIKDFAKKHKSHWPETPETLIELCRRIDRLLDLGRKNANLIKTVDQHQLIKLDFAVEGTHKSSKAAGNRAILWVDNDQRTTTILMVYGKIRLGVNRERRCGGKKRSETTLMALTRPFGLRDSFRFVLCAPTPWRISFSLAYS